MPMFIISIIIGFIVFFYLMTKKKEARKSILIPLIVVSGLMTAGLITTFVIPTEYILIEKYEIVPIEIQNQKYFVVPQRNITYPFFLIKDLDGRIKPGESFRIIEEDRKDGVLKIYRNESKTHRFFSPFTNKKSEAHIPLNTRFKTQ